MVLVKQIRAEKIVWTSLSQKVWINLDRFEQIWTFLNQFGKVSVDLDNYDMIKPILTCFHTF